MRTVLPTVLGLGLCIACGADDVSSMATATGTTAGTDSGGSSSSGGGSASTDETTSGSGTDATTNPSASSSGGSTTLGSSTGDATDSGASTGSTDYDGEPGEFMLQFDQRDYRLYVPSGYTASSPIPVVVGFHGAGDSGGNFYAVANAAGVTAAAEPANYILIVPDTKSPYSDFAVWSGNPSNDVDEMLVEMDEVLDLVDDVGTHYHLAGDRVHPFGFSDGGLFTAVAGMARSDRFASLTILGYGWGGNYPLVTPDRAIPVQFGCGSNDGFYSGAVSSESFLSGQGHPTRFVTANGVGHSFTGILSAMPASDMFAWMNQHTLP